MEMTKQSNVKRPLDSPSLAVRALPVLTLVTLTAVLLVVASEVSQQSGIRLVLFFIAGSTTMALLSLFSQGRQMAVSPRRKILTFNTAIVARSIDEGMRTLGPIEGTSRTMGVEASWQLSPRRLVGQDNSLALAYLRLEIERTLAAIMSANGISAEGRWVGARQMATILAEREVLPGEIVIAVGEVVDACNAAMHGALVADDTALAVVSSGEELLRFLRFLPQPAQ